MILNTSCGCHYDTVNAIWINNKVPCTNCKFKLINPRKEPCKTCSDTIPEKCVECTKKSKQPEECGWREET